jgi:hypothetical protein
MNLLLRDDTNLVHKEHLLLTKPFAEKQKMYVKENHHSSSPEQFLPNSFIQRQRSRIAFIVYAVRTSTGTPVILRFLVLFQSPSTQIEG